jgi:hypothetical protein
MCYWDRMETEQPSPFPIALDEHDTAAVVAILMRAIRAGDQIAEDQEAIKAANARLEENNVTMNKALSALSFFGIEKRAEDQNVWQQVWEVIGKEAYLRAIAVARGAEPGGLLEQMGDNELTREEPKEKPAAALAQRPVAVRDAILRHLRAVGNRGTNVGAIKRHLADAYAITVHEKTPGMTLYRLLKDGLARREGRTWYATDEVGENDPDEMKAGADLT